MFLKDQESIAISLKKQMFSVQTFPPPCSHPEGGSSVFLKMPARGGPPSQLWDFDLVAIFLSQLRRQ